MSKLSNEIKTFFSKIFSYNDIDKYDFVLYETQEEKAIENNSFVENLNNDDKLLENANKNVYPAIEKNLDYMKVKYNSIINSDIIIREFTLTARNKQYKSFLLYIDGMVDSKTINDFILEPLMLKNRANSFDGNENIVSQNTYNNVIVKKVKKFDLLSYIYNSLMPQNSIKKETEFSEIIMGVNSRKLCFVY